MSNTQKIDLIYGKLYCSNWGLYYSVEPEHYASNRFSLEANMPLVFLNYKHVSGYENHYLFKFLYKGKIITIWFMEHDDYNCFEELK